MAAATLMNVDGLSESLSKTETNYELWLEHALPLRIFLACDDQWLSGANGVIGLNLAVVIRVMEEDMYNVEDKVSVLEDVRIIASRARELLNRRA